MSVQPFISELIKAANQVDRLSEMEKTRLLDRAGRTIYEMRDATGIRYRPEHDEADAAWYLRMIARTSEQLSAAEIQRALLDAVELIKALQVMLDARRDIEGPDRI